MDHPVRPHPTYHPDFALQAELQDLRHKNEILSFLINNHRETTRLLVTRLKDARERLRSVEDIIAFINEYRLRLWPTILRKPQASATSAADPSATT